MKPLKHHARKFAQRLLQAEQSSTTEEFAHNLRKAEKHQKKVSKWHQKLEKLHLWGR